MSVFSSLFIISSSLLLFCRINVINGAIWTNANGTVITGDNLLSICDESATCVSDFSKNVYASSEPYLDRQFTQLLFPEMYDQFDSDKECGTGSKFVTMGSCAQIHSPYTPEHPEGELKVTYVEEQYTLKWKNIRESEEPIYDAILDNSAVYWVNDLKYYYTIWSELNADIVFLKWEIKDTNNNVPDDVKSKTYYSLITHNGDATRGSTLTQYEMVSDKFSGLTDAIKAKMITSEQRVFFDSSTNYRELCNTCQTYPIGVRRAVTNIEENIDWYLTIFDASIPDEDVQIIQDTFTDSNGNTVRYAHLHLTWRPTGTTVSLFERDSKTGTYGEFKISDFEDGMNNAHEEYMLNPFCGIDRWFDNHMAITFQDDYLSSLVFKSIMESGYKYTVYNECGSLEDDCVFTFIPLTVYMSEPNGHSLQMVFNPSSYIEFYTTPTQWDPDWCVMKCFDEQATYSYGDTIAAISLPDNDDMDETLYHDDPNNADRLFDQLGLNLDSKNNNNNVVLSGILLFIGVLLVGALIVYRNKMNNNKYEQLPQ